MLYCLQILVSPSDFERIFPNDLQIFLFLSETEVHGLRSMKSTISQLQTEVLIIELIKILNPIFGNNTA